MEDFRPEYLDAVAASRWNLWLLPMFLLAPLLFALIWYRRSQRWVHGAALVGCMIGSWFSFYFYAETIWTTMELHAQTEAEWRDATSDTGRLFGPILVGMPLAVLYTLLWWGVCSLIGLIRGKHAPH